MIHFVFSAILHYLDKLRHITLIVQINFTPYVITINSSVYF